MNKLTLIENANNLIINPVEALTSNEEINYEIELLPFLFCNELSTTNPMVVNDNDKKVYLLPLDYDTQLMNNMDVSLMYTDTLYNMIDTTNSTHTQFILDYNGGNDLDRAMFLTRTGRIHITSCPISEEYCTQNMEALLLNGQAKIGGNNFTITEDWVFEYL